MSMIIGKRDKDHIIFLEDSLTKEIKNTKEAIILAKSFKRQRDEIFDKLVSIFNSVSIDELEDNPKLKDLIQRLGKINIDDLAHYDLFDMEEP